MKKNVVKIAAVLAVAVLVLTVLFACLTVFASETETTGDIAVAAAAEEAAEEAADNSTTIKSIAAAAAIAVTASVGAIAMGFAISKSSESISRQPEAKGDIRSSLMLGLVFIETAIIYALIVAILVIFVL